MNVITNVIICLFLLFGIAAVAALLKATAVVEPRFSRKAFLTDSEVRVLSFLEAALPDYRIMAQVAMGALLSAAETDRRRAHSTRNRFAQKIVDFVVVSRDTAEVIALIELDDRTHAAARDAKRDAMTAAAGYRTIRIPNRPRPTATSVEAAVAGLRNAVTAASLVGGQKRKQAAT